MRAYRGGDFDKNDPQPWKQYLPIPLHGTTFSGHTMKTTLGNTIRSILYAFWYCKKAGYGQTMDEIRANGIHIQGAGDDICIYSDRDKCHQISATIRELTLDSKSSNLHIGIG